MSEWLQHLACEGEQSKDPNSGGLGCEIQVVEQ